LDMIFLHVVHIDSSSSVLEELDFAASELASEVDGAGGSLVKETGMRSFMLRQHV
jgi:hypothetical protein